MVKDSNNNNSSSQQQFKREPAVRIFAQELSSVELTAGKEENEKADRFKPTYAFSMTGAKINRVFVCGVLTEVDEIETSSASFIKGRLVDATGAVGIMAGQYQPEVVVALRDLATKLPAFVAVIGKPNIYKPNDGGCYVSIRPEDIRVVTEQIIETWTAETARQTLDRIRCLKETITSGKGSDEMKAVIAVYEPEIDDLKHMVMVAIGKAATTDYIPKTNGDGGGMKSPQVPPKEEQAKIPASSTSSQTDASSLAQSGTPKANVKAGHALLKELCALAEDGTVGANAFCDRLVQRKLASPDTALSLIKNVMDQGLAYEPKMGRLKAVA
jgi:RPA family protein